MIPAAAPQVNAETSGVPVDTGLTDEWHPTQMPALPNWCSVEPATG
jgi:ornithine carbamoyltransferase